MEQSLVNNRADVVPYNSVRSWHPVNHQIAVMRRVRFIGYVFQPVEKHVFVSRLRVVVERKVILPPVQLLLRKKGKTYTVDAVMVAPFRLPGNPDHLSASVLGSFADGRCGKSFTQYNRLGTRVESEKSAFTMTSTALIEMVALSMCP